MENAILNGKLLVASEVAKDYLFEKQIKKASGRKELRCTDPKCENPIVKYCHGDKRCAYFAHINNVNCDYAEFDKQDKPITKTIRNILYEHFLTMGYDIQKEIKILNRHYTHLFINTKNGEKIAIEIGSKHTSANKADHLFDEYTKKGIRLKWIVINDNETPRNEADTFFLNRHEYNENKTGKLIAINQSGTIVTISRLDLDKYFYNMQEVVSENYPKIFSQSYPVSDVLIKDSDITTSNFDKLFSVWHNKKKRQFDIYVSEHDKKFTETKAKIEAQRKEQERLTEIKLRAETEKKEREKLAANKAKNQKLTRLVLSFAESMKEIIPIIDTDVRAIDSAGNRWFKCKYCGQINSPDSFPSAGGHHGKNYGVCNECKNSGKSTLD